MKTKLQNPNSKLQQRGIAICEAIAVLIIVAVIVGATIIIGYKLCRICKKAGENYSQRIDGEGDPDPCPTNSCGTNGVRMRFALVVTNGVSDSPRWTLLYRPLSASGTNWQELLKSSGYGNGSLVITQDFAGGLLRLRLDGEKRAKD